MEAVSAKLKRHQKEQLHEVADGMLQVYRTLVRMQYLEHSWVQEGPHDISAVLPACERLGLDASIIYLYSILPYIDLSFGQSVDFFQGGGFYDFRDEGGIEEARDPMFADNEEEAMRPWMTPLSSIGNHSTAIIYDARQHVIGMYRQGSGGSSDPNIHEGMTIMTAEESAAWDRAFELGEGDDSDPGSEISNDGGGVDGGQDTKRKKQVRAGSDELTDENEEEDDGHDGDDSGEEEGDEDDDFEDDDPQGNNIWDEMDSRPAPNVLRDMVLWYENLTELPGGEQSGQQWAVELIKPLYLKYGWPRPEFDGDAFLVDQARAYAAQSAKYTAEEPLREVASLKGWLQDEDTPTMRQDREAIPQTTDVEVEWLARWRLWHAEYRASDTKRRLRDAEEEAARLCPGGQCQKPDELPIWELNELQQTLDYHRRQVSGLRQEVEEAGGSDSSPEFSRVHRAYMEKCLRIYQRAYDACQTDAGGRSLTVSQGPDKTVHDRLLANKARMLKTLELEAEAIRGWLTQVPESAPKARMAAEDRLQSHEKNISDLKGKPRDVAEDPVASTA